MGTILTLSMAHSEDLLDIKALGKYEVRHINSHYSACTIIILYITGTPWAEPFLAQVPVFEQTWTMSTG